jgi:hypothetical protein
MPLIINTSPTDLDLDGLVFGRIHVLIDESTIARETIDGIRRACRSLVRPGRSSKKLKLQFRRRRPQLWRQQHNYGPNSGLAHNDKIAHDSSCLLPGRGVLDHAFSHCC